MALGGSCPFVQVLIALALLAGCGEPEAASAAPTAITGVRIAARTSSSSASAHPPTGAGVAAPTPQTARPGGGITPTPRGGLVSPAQLTPADNEALVRLRVGDAFIVNLGSVPVAPAAPIDATAPTLAPVRWTAEISAPAVRARTTDAVRGPYRATGPGAADLTVTGQPLCCGNPGPPELRLRFHIVVQ